MDGEEGAEAGALAGAEAGEDGHIFDESEVWYLADTIPAGTSAAIALLEHRWAIPLREKIQASGRHLARRRVGAPRGSDRVGLTAAGE